MPRNTVGLRTHWCQGCRVCAIRMADFLTEQDCLSPMHSATIAGKVIKVEALKGKSIGTVFHVGDQQCSPSGDVQEMAIGRYLFGAKRTEKASWLKVGENVLVHREAAGQGVVYAHQPEQLLKIGRKPSEDADIDLSGVLRSGR